MSEECDFDLYDVLDEALLSKDVEQKKADEQQKLELQKKLESDFFKLQEEIKAELKKEKERNDQLEQNLSVFTLTASHEIKRKDKQIADLRRELDSLIFRKSANKKTFEKATQTSYLPVKPRDDPRSRERSRNSRSTIRERSREVRERSREVRERSRDDRFRRENSRSSRNSRKRSRSRSRKRVETEKRQKTEDSKSTRKVPDLRQKILKKKTKEQPEETLSVKSTDSEVEIVEDSKRNLKLAGKVGKILLDESKKSEEQCAVYLEKIAMVMEAENENQREPKKVEEMKRSDSLNSLERMVLEDENLMDEICTQKVNKSEVPGEKKIEKEEILQVEQQKLEEATKKDGILVASTSSTVAQESLVISNEESEDLKVKIGLEIAEKIVKSSNLSFLIPGNVEGKFFDVQENRSEGEKVQEVKLDEIQEEKLKNNEKNKLNEGKDEKLEIEEDFEVKPQKDKLEKEDKTELEVKQKAAKISEVKKPPPHKSKSKSSSLPKKIEAQVDKTTKITSKAEVVKETSRNLNSHGRKEEKNQVKSSKTEEKPLKTEKKSVKNEEKRRAEEKEKVDEKKSKKESKKNPEKSLRSEKHSKDEKTRRKEVQEPEAQKTSSETKLKSPQEPKLNPELKKLKVDLGANQIPTQEVAPAKQVDPAKEGPSALVNVSTQEIIQAQKVQEVVQAQEVLSLAQEVISAQKITPVQEVVPDVSAPAQKADSDLEANLAPKNFPALENVPNQEISPIQEVLPDPEIVVKQEISQKIPAQEVSLVQEVIQAQKVSLIQEEVRAQEVSLVQEVIQAQKVHLPPANPPESSGSLYLPVTSSSPPQVPSPPTTTNDSIDSNEPFKENSLNHSQENVIQHKVKRRSYQKEINEDGVVVLTFSRKKKKVKKAN